MIAAETMQLFYEAMNELPDQCIRFEYHERGIENLVERYTLGVLHHRSILSLLTTFYFLVAT